MLREREHIANDHMTGDATGNLFVHTLALIWLIGVIFFDKNMAYVSVGPIYITEFLLACMILCNIRKLQAHDVILGCVFVFYFLGGVIKGRDPFFAIRDLAWLYYLFFLRFFPRDFPKKYIDIVIYACVLRAFLTLLTPIMSGEMLLLLAQKYRDAAVVLFLIGYLSLKSKNGNINFGMAIFLMIVSYLSNYKTLIIIVFVTPFLLPMRAYLARIHSAKILLMSAVVLITLVYTNVAGDLLSASVQTINGGISAAGVTKVYSTDTSIWRAQIWHKALMTLSTWTDILFGEFPGHNFMNSKFLGLKRFFLAGGDRLGALRSAHNIVVQIMMKTGLFGLLTFGWYYFKTFKSTHPTFGLLRIFALILAMTADILEVPSRGPLLFSLFVVLEIIYDRMNQEIGVAEMVVAKSSLNRGADGDGLSDVQVTTTKTVVEEH